MTFFSSFVSDLFPVRSHCATPPVRAHLTDPLTTALDDFDARGPDELTLRRGEKIELVELDDGFGDGWYLGKDLNTGSTGLFPGGKRRDRRL